MTKKKENEENNLLSFYCELVIEVENSHIFLEYLYYILGWINSFFSLQNWNMKLSVQFAT